MEQIFTISEIEGTNIVLDELGGFDNIELSSGQFKKPIHIGQQVLVERGMATEHIIFEDISNVIVVALFIHIEGEAKRIIYTTEAFSYQDLKDVHTKICKVHRREFKADPQVSGRYIWISDVQPEKQIHVQLFYTEILP